MEFNLKYEKVKFWKLNFNNQMPCIDFDFELPFLIDSELNVLLGNSLRKNYDMMDIVNCIVIKKDLLIMDTLLELETGVIEENSDERYYKIKNDLGQYLKSLNEKIEIFSLFELPKETRLISEQNFDKPPKYNFDKGHNKKTEDEQIATLFGNTGE